jgi:hypothetical protein
MLKSDTSNVFHTSHKILTVKFSPQNVIPYPTFDASTRDVMGEAVTQ